MLPEAHVGLLDEGYRANAVLLDNLLALANPVERRFHNGPEVVNALLWTLVIICNQLPDPGDERTEAFRDRMTLTRIVAPVRSDAARAAILRGQLGRDVGPSPEAPLMSREDVAAAQEAAGAVADRRNSPPPATGTDAELVRTALAAFLADQEPPKPRLPLYDSRDPRLARAVAGRPEEARRGFGERPSSSTPATAGRVFQPRSPSTPALAALRAARPPLLLSRRSCSPNSTTF